MRQPTSSTESTSRAASVGVVCCARTVACLVLCACVFNVAPAPVAGVCADVTLCVCREFQKALGCKSSFFVDRVFHLFDENGDGFINFSEFACGIAILSPKGTFAMKVSCSSRLLFRCTVACHA